DVNEGSGQVSFTLSATNGVLTLASTTGLTGSGNGTDSMSYSGLLADVNTALTTVNYEPDDDYAGSDTITLFVSDLGNNGSPGPLTDTHDVDVTVNPINDAPVVAGV